MAAEIASPMQMPTIDPAARLVELFAMECRVCGTTSGWAERGGRTAWEFDHYRSVHPGMPKREWRTYQWTITRQIPIY